MWTKLCVTPVAVAAVLLIVVLGASCSSSDTSSSDTGQTASADAPEPADQASSIAPTATPRPRATPAPTPTSTPVPDPIFTPVEMPAGIVSEPQRTLYDAAPPTDTLDWVGAGHEYLSTTGRSVPIAWSIDVAGSFTTSYLPLPTPYQSGGTWQAAAINGVQIIGGSVRDQTISTLPRQPMLWSRNSSDSEWHTDQLDVVDLPGIDEGNTSVWAVEGSDTWGMLLVGFVAHEEGDDGKRERERFLAATSDGRSWSPVMLPGIDRHNWALDIYITADHGLVIATSTREEPAIILFTTSDRGASWQQGHVAAAGDDLPTINNAHFDGDWILIGDTHTDESTTVPAVFTNSAENTWSPQPIEIDVRDAQEAILTDGSYPPFSELEFAAIHRLDELRFVGLFETNSGTLTATSTNLVQWQLDPDLQLNGPGYNVHDDNVYGLVADSQGDRVLALRGFEPPVWLSRDGAKSARTDAFDSTRLDREALISHQDTFVWFATTDTDDFRTRRWVSVNGIDWEPEGSLLAFRPRETGSVGDAIYSYGQNADYDPRVRIFTEGDGFEFSVKALSSLPFTSELSRVVIVPPTASAGRHVIARSWTAGDGAPYETYISFIDLDTPERLTTYLAPSVGDAAVSIVCPQLDSDETAIVFSLVDEVGSLIEVWADRDEPRVGEGVFSSEVDRNVVGIECSRLGDGLMLTGASCPEDLSSWNEYDCDPRVWVSADGLVWNQHPQQSRLLDGNVAFTRQATRANTAALVTGRVRDGGETTLWYVTSSEILPVPLDGTSGFGGFDINELVVANDRVLLGDDDGIFIGDIAYLAKRARDEGELLGDPPLLPSSDQPPAPDVEAVPGRDTAPIIVNAGSTPDEAAPAPRRPSRVPAPRPTAAPIAPPTTTPPTTAAPAQPQPTATAAPAGPPVLQERVCTTTTTADGSISLDCKYVFES